MRGHSGVSALPVKFGASAKAANASKRDQVARGEVLANFGSGY